MKKKRWLVYGGGALVVTAALVLWLGSSGTSKIEYRVDKVTRGDVAVTISATGTLNAVTTVQVGSQVSGTISKLYADYNDVVTKGQLLAQLDPTFLDASVSEQRANLEKSRAQVNEAERNYNRTKELFAKSLVAQADLDAATTSVESARASLKQAEATLQRAEVNLRYATIRAPISGVVISRSVDVGQTVAASLQAPTLFTIANDLKRMQVEASVDEADIGSVKGGQRATFRVDSYPDEEFEGKVTQVRLQPIVSQNVVTYNVIIEVQNPEQKLMPGMTATVSIEVARKDDVLRVPLLAIRFVPPEEALAALEQQRQKEPKDTTGMAQRSQRWQRREAGGEGMPKNRSTIWTMEEGHLRPHVVRRGLQNTQFAEIEGRGISEGDEIIVGATGGQATQTAGRQQNPFAPQRFGGGRRGGF